jgi:hypothetical protein
MTRFAKLLGKLIAGALPLILFPALAVLPARAQIKASVKASATPSIAVTPAAGDFLVAVCNSPDAMAADNAGNIYVPAGALQKDGYSQTAYVASKVKPQPTIVTCKSTGTVNEIYVADVSGAFSFDSPVNATGASSPTTGSVTTSAAGDAVIAYCQSGSCANVSGWTALSTFDGNLVAFKIQPTPAILQPAFHPSASYTETLIVFHAGTPPPLTLTFPGCCTLTAGPSLTFPIDPSQFFCMPADGQCTDVIQVCDAATPPKCMTGNGGSISIVKTISLPIPQMKTIKIITATPGP